SRENFTVSFSFKAIEDLPHCEFHALFTYGEGTILFHANSRDFDTSHFKLQKGRHNLSFDFQLPVKAGNYDVECALISNGKTVDHWISDTQLSVLDALDQHDSNDPYQGLLSLKARFTVDNVFATELL